MPWSCHIDDIRVTNTCAMDSFLQLLFLMRKYGVIGQHLFHKDKALTEVLNDIDARKFHVARHKWVHHVMQACAENPDVVGKNWSLFGTTCRHSISCKLFQMRARDRFDSCSMEDCPNESSYDSTNEDSIASMTHSITCLDIEGILGDGARYHSLQDFFDSELHSFNKKRKVGSVKRGERCGTNTDGSYMKEPAPDLCGAGWVVYCEETRNWIKGEFVEYSKRAVIYRAEQLGML